MDNNRAAVQSSVAEVMASGFAGQWYDISDTEAVSRTVQHSAIPFGIAVVKGTNDNQCRLPDHGGYLAAQDAEKAATTKGDNPFVGITMFHVPSVRHSTTAKLKKPIGDDDSGYLLETEVSSLATHGRIYVICDSDVKQGQKVYFRHTLDDNTASPQTQQLGSLGSQSGANFEQIVGAEWMYSQTKGGLAVIKLTGAHQS